jgi:hypothetical protein
LENVGGEEIQLFVFYKIGVVEILEKNKLSHGKWAGPSEQYQPSAVLDPPLAHTPMTARPCARHGISHLAHLPCRHQSPHLWDSAGRHDRPSSLAAPRAPPMVSLSPHAGVGQAVMPLCLSPCLAVTHRPTLLSSAVHRRASSTVSRPSSCASRSPPTGILVLIQADMVL